jgi:tRNA(Ile)-lysidine synthetase-like protein
MTPLARKVHHNLKNILNPGDTVMVAFSGGKDSMCLTGALLENHELRLNLILCHINHGIRKEAGQDSQRAVRFAKKLGLPIVVRKLHLGKHVSEEEARNARLNALEGVAYTKVCRAILTAHTASDQLETILMRLCRGTGLVGASGICVDSGYFIRPLLSCTSKEVCDYLNLRGWEPIEDKSNHTDSYTRNRFRHHVVPFFLKENEKAEEAAQKFSLSLKEAVEALNFYAVEAYRKVVEGEKISVKNFNKLPKYTKVRVLSMFHENFRGKKEQLSSSQINNFISILNREVGNKIIQLPGLVLYMNKGFVNVGVSK